LTAFKKASGSEGTQLVPDLATSLPTPTDGGRTYAFEVRPNVRYSTGAVVKPADFRYAIERDIKLGSQGVRFYAGIVGARECLREPKRCDLSSGIVTDETARTVTFHLVAPIWTGSDPALTQVAQTFVPLLERLGFEAHLKVVPDRVYRQTVNDSRTRARRWARR
jgi:ABC-type transport system substrate-binding protein